LKVFTVSEARSLPRLNRWENGAIERSIYLGKIPQKNGENERSFGVDTRINKHKCNFPLLIVLYLKNI